MSLKNVKKKKNVDVPTTEFGSLLQNFAKDSEDLKSALVESPMFVDLIDFALDKPDGFVLIVRYLLSKGCRKIIERSMWAKTKGDKVKFNRELARFGGMAKKLLEGSKIERGERIGNTGDALLLGMMIIGLAGANMQDCSKCDKKGECTKKDGTKMECNDEEKEIIPGYM